MISSPRKLTLVTGALSSRAVRTDLRMLTGRFASLPALPRISWLGGPLCPTILPAAQTLDSKVPEAPETPESSSGSLFHIERGGQEHLSTAGSWVLGDP